MKKIKFLFLAISCLGHLYISAGIGAQFNIDNEVKALTAEQKTHEDTLKQSPPSSPRSILKKQSKYASQQDDGFFIGLLKCLQQ